MLLLSVLSALSPASAFPGAYLGDASGQPVNTRSVITVARFGDQTVLTLQPDVQGPLSTFGLVIPVPPEFTRADLSLVSPHALRRADQTSAPRLLNTSCEDLHAEIEPPQRPRDTGPEDTDPLGPCAYSGGCKEGTVVCARDTEPLPDWFAVPEADLSVLDEFELGEYTGWILTPNDGETLADWMAQQGFIAGEDTATSLDALVEQGSAFVALRVTLDEAPRQPVLLSPIQLKLRLERWTLPMQLGATSSAGVQDVTLITLTDPDEGATVVKNLAATPLPEDGCMVRLDEGGWADLWDERFTQATGLPARAEDLPPGAEAIVWSTELSELNGRCDPCGAPPLTWENAHILGFPEDGDAGYRLTRLHLRYTPTMVPDGLVLAQGEDRGRQQEVYHRYRWELEGELPICDGSPSSPPGTCYSAEYWERAAAGEIPNNRHTTEAPPMLGCRERREPVVAFLFTLPISLMMFFVRRRP